MPMRFQMILIMKLDEFTNSKELMKMENIYDILFLDVQLEDGMNGIEVGKRLLQKELMPRLSLQPLLSSMHRKAII